MYQYVFIRFLDQKKKKKGARDSPLTSRCHCTAPGPRVKTMGNMKKSWKMEKVRKFSRGRKLNKWVIKEGKDEVKTRRERVNEGR